VVQAVLRPTVTDFLDFATRVEHMELNIEETQIGPGSPLVGSTLKESRMRQDLRLIVVGIKKGSGAMLFNPAPEARIEAGDILVILGHRQDLDQLLARAGA
jgi:voltage-gated potassium channel